MKAKGLYILLLSLLFTNNSFSQQKVGLVLSGGGATGIAHIGVLKALEENEIPIDFITGTSAGAMIGGLYAAGYSPEEIEAFILSDKFLLMSTGGLEPNQNFLFRAEEANAGLVGMSFSQDDILNKSLPTNFTSATLMDFEMMRNLGVISASTGNNFDSLFVPFRCVASDIANKKSIILKDGHLNAAVRASMTYPFYFKSISIDSVLLFDGGLYNNFPADIMYESFDPDYIIGSNVSHNTALPEKDDIISQLTNMLVSYSDFGLPCESGFIIEPETKVSTFNFKDAEEAIADGYRATIANIDSIKANVSGRRTREELIQRRKAFRDKALPIAITSVTIDSDKKKLRYSSRSILKKKKETLNVEQLEKRYFRLHSASQVDFLYPRLNLKEDSTFNLDLTIHKAKELRLTVGGHFSSRPVNTGYVGLSYQSIGKIITKTHLESYFGKFYGSVKAKFTVELPRVYPASLGVYFTLNRWDYFRSFSTFFEDVQPSFLVQNEIYTGIQINHPLGNTIKSTLDGRWFTLNDEYYQTEDFTNKDTADVTHFLGGSASWTITQNSLNRKQFASSGHLLTFNARYTYGREHSISGSTSIQPYDEIKYHSNINLGIDYQTFIVDQSFFHLGLHGQIRYNSHRFFSNYTATLLTMSEFSPVPDAQTYFLPEYRSPQFIGAGINTIFTIKHKVDIRADAYVYQPITQVLQNPDGTMYISELFKGRTYMASSSIIYHSFIGPIRLTLNYFPKQTNPLALQFSVGYVIFNDRAVR